MTDIETSRNWHLVLMEDTRYVVCIERSSSSLVSYSFIVFIGLVRCELVNVITAIYELVRVTYIAPLPTKTQVA